MADPNRQDAANNVRQLLQALCQEFEALQQQHDVVLKEKDCLIQIARSGMDIDDFCKGEGNMEWPVLTFDADSQKTEVQLKKESPKSVMSLMHGGGVKADARGCTEVTGPHMGDIDALTAYSRDDLNTTRDELNTTRDDLNNTQDEGLRDFEKELEAQGFAEVTITPKAHASGQQGIGISPRACKKFGTPLSRAESDCSKGCKSTTSTASQRSVLEVALETVNVFSLKFGLSSDSVDSSQFTGFRKQVYNISCSPWFESAFALMILTNSVVMCVEFQKIGNELGWAIGYAGSGNAPDVQMSQTPFEVLEWIFGITFCLELLFKLVALRVAYFQDLWNWIDIVTVFFFVLEKIAGTLLPVPSQWIRICRLARLVRLIRMVRTIEGFDHLYLMTTAIKGSVRILGWAIGLLLAIQMTIALIVGQLLHVSYFENGSGTIEDKQAIYEYFGTFSRSLLSIFELTLANWPPITRLLTEEVSEWFMLFCVIHKLTVGFAVVGVINGVFMQETFKCASTDDVIMVRQKEKASARHRKNMQELFDGLDSSGDGRVNLAEFRALANYPTVKAWLASMEIRTNDLDTMYHLMDIDDSGGITFEEMLHGMETLKGHARSVDLFRLLHELKDAEKPLKEKQCL